VPSGSEALWKEEGRREEVGAHPSSLILPPFPPGGGGVGLLLPAAFPVPAAPRAALPAGDPPVRLDGPVLDGAALGALARRLREGRAAGLERLPVEAVAAAIDRAVAAFANPRPEEVERLAAVTGYHPAMVAWGLADLARTFRFAELVRLLRRELGDPAVLDRFVPRTDGRGAERAHGPALTVLVLAGNVFHAAAESIVRALLVKSACCVKPSARDPLFPLLFARALAAADERLAAALAVVYWRGGDAAAERAVFAEADAVVVEGGAEAVAGARDRTPATARFVAHGPKVSFAVVSEGAAADPETARAAAHDVAAFDQQGCVSPHLVYVEGEEAAARAFAGRLAGALARVEAERPRGRITPAEAGDIQQLRGAAEFRPGAEVLADPTGTAWTVIVQPDPAFALSCLNRVVHVRPLARLDDLPGLLTPVRPYLQTVGVAGDAALYRRVAELTGPLGVARVCPLGRMAHPPADWRHDGRPRLLDLLRWTEIELPPSAGRHERPRRR
jgi:hypothetical protein